MQRKSSSAADRLHLAGMAAALLLGPGCSTGAAKASRDITLYKCAGDRSFTVERDDESAIIGYSDRRYELARRSSSIGERYANSEATLIIDGDMAAFVTASVVDLDFCRASEMSS